MKTIVRRRETDTAARTPLGEEAACSANAEDTEDYEKKLWKVCGAHTMTEPRDGALPTGVGEGVG